MKLAIVTLATAVALSAMGSDSGRPSPAPAPAAPTVIEDALGAVPRDTPRMEAYSHGGYALAIAGAVWSIAVLFAIVATGLGSRIERFAGKITRHVRWKVTVYAVLFGLLTFALALPLSAYTSFVREKAYGFANQTFGAWFGDAAKGLAVGLILQTALFTVIYTAIRRFGRRWWIAGSALGIGGLVLVVAIGPVFIAPLFNDFAPIEDAELRRDILALANAQGIGAHEVYQVDASRQSEHADAYVAGLFGTERIVLYDTLMERFAPREIRFVLAHEVGHHVRRHVWKSIALTALLIIVGFWLTDRLARRTIARWPGLGIGELAAPASIPLVALILSLLLFVTGPAARAVSRAEERDADRFALDLTRDPIAAASCLLKFGRHGLGEYDVDPWIEALLYGHPSLGRRIGDVRAWARAHPRAE